MVVRRRTRKGRIKYVGKANGFVVTMYRRRKKHGGGLVANVRRRKIGEPLGYVTRRRRGKRRRRKRR